MATESAPSPLLARINEFNEKVAARGTVVFGSMWAFYVFFVWGLLAFVPQLAHWKETILLISSAWIQLWALPLLMVGGIVLNRASEKRAEEDHETITKEFELVKANQVTQVTELAEARVTRAEMHDLARLIPDIVARLERIEARLAERG
ncbi:MAG: hypothetical protein HZB16_23795 [Armatimonadetes bacterium]|nr:hypothetical protein [Armatimonadota bacterium]